MKRINLLWAGKTGDANAWYHIFPFVITDLVKKVDVIRYKKPNRLIPGINFISFSSRNKFVESICFIFQLVRNLFTFKHDIVISFNPYPWGIITFSISKIFRKKIIIGLIGGEVEKQRSSKRAIKILLFVLKHSNAVTVTGSKMRRNLVLLGIDKNKIFVFPHLTDAKFMLEQKSDKRKSQKFDLLTISSFLEVKKTSDAINALAILHKNNYMFTLCILGDGELKSEYLQLVKDLNLTDFVFFVGYQKDIRPFLFNSDYYIQTSLSEGLSIALIEAMTVGLIPIVTNAGDEKDIIKEGVTGFVVPINSPAKIAETILNIEKSSLKKSIKKNLYQSRLDFDIHNSSKKIDGLLTFVTNG